MLALDMARWWIQSASEALVPSLGWLSRSGLRSLHKWQVGEHLARTSLGVRLCVLARRKGLLEDQSTHLLGIAIQLGRVLNLIGLVYGVTSGCFRKLRRSGSEFKDW